MMTPKEMHGHANSYSFCRGSSNEAWRRLAEEMARADKTNQLLEEIRNEMRIANRRHLRTDKKED